MKEVFSFIVFCCHWFCYFYDEHEILDLKTIDLNADLGEGAANDALIMPLISSCNIACGGHYGTTTTMRDAIRLAQLYNVKIGAHPSFPDKENFGRTILKMSKSALKLSIDGQLRNMIAECESLGVTLHHVKPHGALYNLAAVDVGTAEILITSILDTNLKPVVYAPENSVLYKLAKQKLPVKAEAFIDRRYTDELQLVSRSEENAVINNPQKAWEQLRHIYNDNSVISVLGSELPLKAETFCVHGDSLNAFKILEYIHTQLQLQNIALQR